MSIFDLSGKKAIVTGASSGLGVQFAKALAAQGADVAIVARRLEKLEEVKAEIEALGVSCLAVKCDVLNTEDIVNAVAEVKSAFGRIDILVNNAGVANGIPAEKQKDEKWLRVIDTNLNSVFYFAREVGKVMIEQQYGRIINIGSIHSAVAMLEQTGMYISSYAASKGGVFMLTKALAAEWAKQGITVNAIGPSYFSTEMTGTFIENPEFAANFTAYCPMGRPGKPGELNGAVIYFASDASSFTTGQILYVDGGWTSI
jgi:gluconate 5-dehydrogenase